MLRATDENTTRRTLVKALAAAPFAIAPPASPPWALDGRICELAMRHRALVAGLDRINARMTSLAAERRYEAECTAQHAAIAANMREIAGYDATTMQGLRELLEVFAWDLEADGLSGPTAALFNAILRSARGMTATA